MPKEFYSLAVTLIIAFTLFFAADLQAAYVCGDADGNEIITISDAVFLINYVFAGGSAPNPVGAGDPDYNGFISISDVVFLINYIFAGGPEPYCSQYTAPPTTIIVPENDVTTIQDFDSTSGTLTLDESSTFAQETDVGDIVIGQDDSAAPYGFLRRITSKSVQGGSVIVETEPATLMDAFEDMDVVETHPLSPSEVVSYKLFNGSKLIPDRNSDLFSIDMNVILYDLDGDPGTTNDQIRLDGNYAFTAELFAKIKMRFFSLRKFEVGVKTNETANLDLTANFQWQFNEAAEFDLAEFHLGAIPVGGFVWLVPTLTVEAHIRGDLTVTFTTGISYTQELRYGVGYENGSYYTIGEGTKNFNYTPPQFTAEFNFEPGASINASCLLYGVAGPYMAGKTGFHFQSVFGVGPCGMDLTFDLDAILYAVAGVECDILNLDYNQEWQLYTHPIGEWTFPLGGFGTIVIDPEPDAINAPWSLAGPCNYSSNGAGDQTLTSLYPGEYTVTWGAVSGWTTPSNVTQTLTAGNTLTLSGVYGAINTIPVVTTAIVSTITQTTAQSGGNITSDGGAAVTARGVCWSTNPTPTVADNKTTDGTGTGSFTSAITGLTAGTNYYVRAYATNIAGTGYGSAQPFTTTGASGTVTDIDGNVYQTVTIGTQVWMMENLKVTHYRNGDPIPNVTEGSSWGGLTIGAYSNYNNDQGNVATYGRLYNWYAIADSRNIAPAGWHVPTDAEWKQLEMALGMSQAQADSTGVRGTDEGGKLKEAGTTHWFSPNTGATNESGFSALPGGWRSNQSGDFVHLGILAHFWCSSEDNYGNAFIRRLDSSSSWVIRGATYIRSGFSVRCVKDVEDSTVTDIDGNVYQTVTIGSQVWMMENLKVTHYRNGDPIPNVTDGGTWGGLTTGAYCNYNNDQGYVATYGRLYNWYAVADSRNIAPAGWHVPTDEEWKQLEMYLGMSQAQADTEDWRGTDEGGKLKEAGTTHWASPNTGATNESGYTALPGGIRYYDGSNFDHIGYDAIFWSLTDISTTFAWYRILSFGESQVGRAPTSKKGGFSVRCVKD